MNRKGHYAHPELSVKLDKVRAVNLCALSILVFVVMFSNATLSPVRIPLIFKFHIAFLGWGWRGGKSRYAVIYPQ